MPLHTRSIDAAAYYAACLLLLVAWAGWAPCVQAQPDQGFAEVGLMVHGLTGGHEAWRGVFVQGVRNQGPRRQWRGEAVFQERFGAQGFHYIASHTYTFNDRWFGRAQAGVSSGGFYLPRYNVGGTAARKWGARRQWVTALGLNYVEGKLGQHDLAFNLETQWYFHPVWVGQASVRLNLNRPDGGWSRQYYVALTQGKPYRHYASLRVAFGTEAYQVIAPLVVYAGFESLDLMASWRQWIQRSWGVSLHAMYYHSDYFNRAGFQVAFFKHW